MKRRLSSIIVSGSLLACPAAHSDHHENHPKLKFERQEIAKIEIGYGLAIGDVDGDGKKDILLADKREIAWFKNPSWDRHLMAKNLSLKDNVCIAAEDLDGDGKVEVAVGANWNPGETTDAAQSGSIHYLQRPEDPTSRWNPINLPNEPTVHRMHWLKQGGDNHLVVLPLHGRGNKGGSGKPVKVIAYKMPKDPGAAWQQLVLNETMHMTHNFDQAPNGVFYIAGKEGISKVSVENETPKTQLLKSTPPSTGAGEVRAFPNGTLASIEPMHGNELCVYLKKPAEETRQRILLTDDLGQGHALAVAPILADGKQQIIAGWRNKNKEGKVGIKLFTAPDDDWTKSRAHWIDDNGIACEDLKVVDMDDDNKLDIIAAGRATKNLVIYWNK